MDFQLTSRAFQHGGTIPERYTCDGEDLSPDLKWEAIPEGTKSFVLIMDDPDAPMQTFTHWVVYNIPAACSVFEKGTCEEGMNDFQKVGYGGPCPPRGNPHRYFFTLYALDIEEVCAEEGAAVSEIEANMEGHILGKAVLIGLYQRV